jgi:uncharacterized protein (UPF0335 family)
MSKIHNLVYDLEEAEVQQEYGSTPILSEKAKDLVKRIEYLKWEKTTIMEELKDVYRQLAEEVSK